MNGHGWMPMSFQDLIRMMAEHIGKNAPAGEDTLAWNYWSMEAGATAGAGGDKRWRPS